MADKARYATVHRMRFEGIRTPETLDLGRRPEGALSWKIGPSGEIGPDGYRLPAAVWCAIGLYRNLEDAADAMTAKQEFMPFLAEARESWHGLLLPILHRGECNYLEREEPDTIFEASQTDGGGMCMVVTTAGFVPGPDFRVERVIDFRRNVDLTNEWMGQAPGCLANQVFTPHTVGDDGCTMSIWTDDAAMLAAAYRPGGHRAQIDRHKEAAVMDRSSFTRFRILEANGEWDGRNPARVALSRNPS